MSPKNAVLMKNNPGSNADDVFMLPLKAASIHLVQLPRRGSRPGSGSVFSNEYMPLGFVVLEAIRASIVGLT